MKLKRGYSYATVTENIAAAKYNGLQNASAVAVAYNLARVSFFRAHPSGALPEWLAHPKGYRLREHYDNSGHSVKEFAENPALRIGDKMEWKSQKGYSKPGEIVTVQKIRGEQIMILSEPDEQEKQGSPEGFSYWVLASELSPTFAKNPVAPNPHNLRKAAQLFEDFTGKRASRITKHSLPEIPNEGLVFGTLVQVGYESARDGKLYRHTFRERSRPLLVATPDGKTVLIVGGRYAFTDRGIEDR